VIAVYGQRHHRLTPEWLERIRTRFDAVLVLGSPAAPDSGAPSRAATLGELSNNWPGRPVLLLRAGLELPPRFEALLARAAASSSEPIVFPGNYGHALDPLRGLNARRHSHDDLDRLVGWASDGVGEWVSEPAVACLLLPAESVSGDAVLPTLDRALLIDDGYVIDPRARRNEDSTARVDEDEDPPPLGHLARRVGALLAEGVALPSPDPGDRGVTLHVTHSWGGGVWRWIDDLAAGDPDHRHLVLIADSDASGEVCGRALKLCAAGPGRGVIRELALSPRIGAISNRHEGYAEHLRDISRRFGVTRIIVSSPIGHSLDVLRTGLPTLFMLHDFFPLWPMLDHDPLPFLNEADGDPDRARAEALRAHGKHMRLMPREAGFWNRVAADWLEAVERHDVRLAAPASHVVRRWRALAGNADLPIEMIEHGFRPFADSSEGAPERAPRQPDIKRPLHLVIPGRLTVGKGLDLLRAVLPRLNDHVRFTALGCGKSGLALMGYRGVDLIPQYQRDDLPELIRDLRPDAALFLSTVPETWNYALSEMRALGLTPLATRVGSFPERIRDGEDGFLFEPEPDALVALIERLETDREALSTAGATASTPRAVEDVAADLDCVLPSAPAPDSPPFQAADADRATRMREAARLAGALERAERARADLDRLGEELQNRSRWAETMERQFRARSQWADSLNRDMERARGRIDELDLELSDRTRWARELNEELDRERERIAGLNEELSERTEWARALDQSLERARTALADLRQEFEQRTEWAKRLDNERQRLEQVLAEQIERFSAELEQVRSDLESTRTELEGTRTALEGTRTELEGTRTELESTRTELEGTRTELEGSRNELERTRNSLDDTRVRLEQANLEGERLRGRLEEITTSRSWRLTRPMRVARRLVTRRRLRAALNPLRWPHLLRLLIHRLRTQGLRGTLELLQAPPSPEAAPVVEPVATPVPEAIAEPVRFDRLSEPEVSVIIPIYNQLHFTSNCLASLAAARTQVSFEVIVVDDASSDGSLRWLKRCDGVRAVRNRRNLGFIGTCNRGASLARGRRLVFLNNDTRVTDGWLDALIRTFDTEQNVGVVGGRLVFADGSLQEAGGIVFRDASGWNFGRGENPDRPEFNVVSETDYVSGACLAIHRELFKDLGGFDSHYAPAYYEDTDLCFKVRARGLKVVYQPAATVIHFEGGTSGTDETAGVKRHQVINRERFAKRWAGTLAAHPENPGEYSLEQACRFRYRRFPRNALVIDAVTPMPDHDSGSVRMFALLRLLRDLGFFTRFMPQNLAWAGRHSTDLQQAGIEVLTAPWLNDPAAWLKQHGADLDLIIISRHYVMTPLLKALREHCPNARLVFDTVDLHFLREQREAELADFAAAARAAERTREEELALIEAADATLVVSEFERELLADLTPEAKVAVVSNIHSLQDPGRPFEQRRDLVFVGGFQHPPNIDAAQWLLDDILPGIRAELPDVRLHLIGSKMPDHLRERSEPGVVTHGFVADLQPYMSGCRLSLAPLRYGAGVKGKVNQAMSHGLPVVATSCAAEGMYTEHEVDILMADTADDFAAEVIRVYQDRELWEKLAANGRLNVQKYFSVDAARRAVEGVIQGLNLK